MAPVPAGLQVHATCMAQCVCVPEMAAAAGGHSVHTGAMAGGGCGAAVELHARCGEPGTAGVAETAQWALRARAARTQLMRAGGLLRGLAVRWAWRGWRARVRAQAGWWQEWQQAQEERRREEAEAAEQELVDYIVGDVWNRGVDMGCGTEAAASLVQLCSRGLARCSRRVAAAERDEQAARLRAETEERRGAKELAV